MENIDKIEVRKDNLKLLWLISDKWFRILECSLIIAMLYYLKQKTGNILIEIVYWISWGVLYMWFMEIGEYISEIINSKLSFFKDRKMFAWIISMFFIIAIYNIVINVTNSIMSAK